MGDAPTSDARSHGPGRHLLAAGTSLDPSVTSVKPSSLVLVLASMASMHGDVRQPNETSVTDRPFSTMTLCHSHTSWHQFPRTRAQEVSENNEIASSLLQTRQLKCYQPLMSSSSFTSFAALLQTLSSNLTSFLYFGAQIF